MKSFESSPLHTADPWLLSVANGFQAEAGRPLLPEKVRHPSVDPSNARVVARALDVACHDPSDPKVTAAYSALCQSLHNQYTAFRLAGLAFEPWLADGQPYDTSADLRRDLLAHRRLRIYLHAEFLEGHPLDTDSRERVGSLRLTWNHLLRYVHDAFGHVLFNCSFSPSGEQLAARVHAAMCSEEARPALFTETVAQKCWYFFGPASHIPVETPRPYPTQKAVVLDARLRRF